MATRECYRIVYPELARPRLHMLVTVLGEDGVPQLKEVSGTASILDCCEVGLRFRAPATWPRLALGDPLTGQVDFRLSSRSTHQRAGCPAVPIHGSVVRSEGAVVALHLDAPGIPFGLLLREQCALMARYPGWLRPATPPAAVELVLSPSTVALKAKSG